MAKILIVDDDQSLTQLTKVGLTLKGYEVAVAHSTGKALEEIKRKEPDLILMDIMMPGISGAEAVKMFKKDTDLKNIPVIFLTGLVSSGEENVEKSGIKIDGIVYQTLGKPYDIEELLKLVRKNLS